MKRKGFRFAFNVLLCAALVAFALVLCGFDGTYTRCDGGVSQNTSYDYSFTASSTTYTVTESTDSESNTTSYTITIPSKKAVSIPFTCELNRPGNTQMTPVITLDDAASEGLSVSDVVSDDTVFNVNNDYTHTVITGNLNIASTIGPVTLECTLSVGYDDETEADNDVPYSVCEVPFTVTVEAVKPAQTPTVRISNSFQEYECGAIPSSASFTATPSNDDGVAYTYTYKWEHSETQNERDWHEVSGATTATCPIDSTLLVGDHYYRCTVTATRNDNGESATSDNVGIVEIKRGAPTYTLPTVNLEYGDKLSDCPLPDGWSWVDETQEAGTPGAKTFKATFTPDDEVNYYPVTVDLNVTVAKRDVTITAKDRRIIKGGSINNGEEYATYDGLAPNDFVFTVVFTSSDTNMLTNNGAVTPTRVIIENSKFEIVTDYYNVTFVSGLLRVAPAYVFTNVETAAGAPVTYVYNLDEDLALSLLTDDELAAYNSGTDIKVYLTVKKIPAIPGNEYKPLQKYLKDNSAVTGMMLDISLWKQIGDGEPIKIENTGDNAVSIGIVIPDGMLGHGLPTGTCRLFSVFRFHDGNMELLSESDEQTQIFESNLFSDYVITYRDEDKNLSVFGEDAAALPPEVGAGNDAASDETTESAVKVDNSKKSPQTGASPETAVAAFSAAVALAAALGYRKKSQND